MGRYIGLYRQWQRLNENEEISVVGDMLRRVSQERTLRGVYSDTTQLNSTSSCRHVHSVNNCHLSMNVVTQLTQFVGRDVINKNTTDLAVRCSTGSVESS